MSETTYDATAKPQDSTPAWTRVGTSDISSVAGGILTLSSDGVETCYWQITPSGNFKDTSYKKVVEVRVKVESGIGNSECAIYFADGSNYFIVYIRDDSLFIGLGVWPTVNVDTTSSYVTIRLVMDSVADTGECWVNGVLEETGQLKHGGVANGLLRFGLVAVTTNKDRYWDYIRWWVPDQLGTDGEIESRGTVTNFKTLLTDNSSAKLRRHALLFKTEEKWDVAADWNAGSHFGTTVSGDKLVASWGGGSWRSPVVRNTHYLKDPVFRDFFWKENVVGIALLQVRGSSVSKAKVEGNEWAILTEDDTNRNYLNWCEWKWIQIDITLLVSTEITEFRFHQQWDITDHVAKFGTLTFSRNVGARQFSAGDIRLLLENVGDDIPWDIEFDGGSKPDAATDVWVLPNADHASSDGDILTISNCGIDLSYYRRITVGEKALWMLARMKVSSGLNTSHCCAIYLRVGGRDVGVYLTDGYINISRAYDSPTTHAWDTTSDFVEILVRHKPNGSYSVWANGTLLEEGTVGGSGYKDAAYFGKGSITSENGAFYFDRVAYYEGSNEKQGIFDEYQNSPTYFDKGIEIWVGAEDGSNIYLFPVYVGYNDAWIFDEAQRLVNADTRNIFADLKEKKVALQTDSAPFRDQIIYYGAQNYAPVRQDEADKTKFYLDSKYDLTAIATVYVNRVTQGAGFSTNLTAPGTIDFVAQPSGTVEVDCTGLAITNGVDIIEDLLTTEGGFDEDFDLKQSTFQDSVTKASGLTLSNVRVNKTNLLTIVEELLKNINGVLYPDSDTQSRFAIHIFYPEYVASYDKIAFEDNPDTDSIAASLDIRHSRADWINKVSATYKNALERYTWKDDQAISDYGESIKEDEKLNFLSSATDVLDVLDHFYYLLREPLTFYEFKNVLIQFFLSDMRDYLDFYDLDGFVSTLEIVALAKDIDTFGLTRLDCCMAYSSAVNWAFAIDTVGDPHLWYAIDTDDPADSNWSKRCYAF